MTKHPQPPPHPHPRVWLITNTHSPLGQSVARHVLSHGDFVLAGVADVDCLQPSSSSSAWDDYSVEGGRRSGEWERREDLRRFWEDVMGKEGWRERCKAVGVDERIMGQCQAAVAEAVEAFGRLDILFCCDSEALIGTVEEVGASTHARTLSRELFERNFFGPVNMIKAALPAMRRRGAGHIMVVTGISHLGTPGLGMYCAAGWALEGFCDSLAYEIAPFGIKLTVLQPSVEVGVLTGKVVSAPELPSYEKDRHPAPLFRGIMAPLLERIQGGYDGEERGEEVFPTLTEGMKRNLLRETVHAVVAVGGKENPPARHIVGAEGVASVKEKLKTVSEELEDFVDVSCAVDIESGGNVGGDGDGDGDGGEVEGEEW